jgi:hypothetical protein
MRGGLRIKAGCFRQAGGAHLGGPSAAQGREMVREILKGLNRSFSKLYLPTRSPTS